MAGTDTTSGTVEWAMAELIRRPTKMSRLRNEVTSFIQKNGEFQESDIPRLPYLQAVVKETFRLHPATPLLVPCRANSDIQINGHIVPDNEQVLINAWAIGRVPNIWTNAEEFMPERFLQENSAIDFRGQDFELIPFGAGRRICPGLPLAHRMVHHMLATFVDGFEWKLEAIKPEELNMDEKFGLTIQKAVFFKAIPMKP